MRSTWAVMTAFALVAGCTSGGVEGGDPLATLDAGDPWGDLMWSDPPARTDAGKPPEGDPDADLDASFDADLDASSDGASGDASDAPVIPVDVSPPPAGLGESCAAARACIDGLRCACRSGGECLCTRTCDEGSDPCAAPTVCTTTPLGRLCLPGDVGVACGVGSTCPTGLRCACGTAAGCLCTRACDGSNPACPAPTVCTTTGLGRVCLPPASSLDASVPDASVPDVPATPDVPSTPDVPATPDVPVGPIDVTISTERVPACITTASGGEGGGTCGDLAYAYTARGINAGYYPFRVRTPVTQFSGDFDGDPSRVFARGRGAAGVVLQEVPAGAYLGLSTVGPNYDPPTDCEVSSCGNASRHACSDNSPPLRAPAGAGGRFYWGYAYNGASHMQGWFLVLPGSIEFAGYDAQHPCALGPAGADYEVRSACGRATSCRGTNPTCGAVNRCNEGSDDCGRTQCGAMSGGTLTPSSWRRTVTLPSGTHACVRTPPHPSVRCLENGSDRDFFFAYPFGAYLYWAQNSTTKAWIHYGDRVQVYFHNRDAQGVLWDFVEVLSSGAPTLTPASDGSGGASPCSDTNPGACRPCRNGGTCGWVQDIFLR